MSQINFFLTEEETLQKLNEVLNKDEFTIFERGFFSSSNPLPLAISDITTRVQSKDLIFWVNNKYTKPTCSGKCSGDYVGQFRFDDYYDPIIEFDYSRINDTLISPGRVFYKAGWIDNVDLRGIHKRQSEKIVRIFRKNLTTVSKPFKISSGIRKLITDGYEIELGHGGLRIDKSTLNGV